MGPDPRALRAKKGCCGEQHHKNIKSVFCCQGKISLPFLNSPVEANNATQDFQLADIGTQHWPAVAFIGPVIVHNIYPPFEPFANPADLDFPLLIPEGVDPISFYFFEPVVNSLFVDCG